MRKRNARTCLEHIDFETTDENNRAVICPDGCIKIILPFDLSDDADGIKLEIDFKFGELTEKEEENAEFYTEIDWRDIFKNAAEFTANVLNLKGRYGGSRTYPVIDHHIFWIIEKEYAHELCEKYNVNNYDDMLLALANENIKAFDEIYEENEKSSNDDDDEMFTAITQVDNEMQNLYLRKTNILRFARIYKRIQ